MRRVLADRRREFAAVVGLFVIACVVGGYILVNQRLPLPWEDTYRLKAQFASAQAVTPGQGQQVAVSGVPVGELARVTLDEGVAVVEMEIDRDKLAAVHADARAVLRPKTPLQDMQVQLDPGTRDAPRLQDGATLPEEATRRQVQLDEVLSLLDDDTRHYVTTTIDAMGRGLRGRSDDLREVLRASGPTLEATARVTGAIAERRRELRRLTGALRRLTGAVGAREDDVARLVSAAGATFSAIGAEDDALRSGLEALPGTLRETREALEEARPLARRLPHAVRRLRPAVRALAPGLEDVRPLLRPGASDLQRVRGLVRDARPLAREATPALTDLRAQTPDLRRVFDVGEELVNQLAHNPDGPDEGYLFWLAWFAHNAHSVVSTGDANGPLWHGMLALSCSTPALYPRELPAAVGALFDLARACPGEDTP